MAKAYGASRSIDLSADELYRIARALTDLDEIERLLRKRWGARSTTVLHIDAVKADMDDVFLAESSHQERGIMSRHLKAEQPSRDAALSAAVAEMEALPKPR